MPVEPCRQRYWGLGSVVRPGPHHAVRQFRAVPAGNPLHVNEDTTDIPSRRGTSRSRATPLPTPQLSGKRIDDRQPIDPSAGLKVVCQEPIAPCLQGRRDDQRIVGTETAHPGQFVGRQMRVDGDGTNRGRRGAQIRQGFADRGPLKTELAPQHGGTLFQNVNADDTACEDRLPSSLAFVSRALGLDQQVGVEKRRYLAFASVRSKANPLGVGNARARIRSTARARRSSFAKTMRPASMDTISNWSPGLRPRSSTTALGSRTARRFPHRETCMVFLTMSLMEGYQSADRVRIRAGKGRSRHRSARLGVSAACAKRGDGSGRPRESDRPCPCALQERVIPIGGGLVVGVDVPRAPVVNSVRIRRYDAGR